jgi:alpha-glucosidase
MTKQIQTNPNWWRHGVIYQVYPRSFQDTNADGIGDIPGIIKRLPYLASLGVDAVWISPFFRSPMKDFGYDVADYCDIDPMFGTLADYDELVAKAHELGLRIMIDLVLSHSSDQHSWFVESRSSRDNPRADWYVWADAKPDGTPPNNWLSLFGGQAWQWDTRRQQYYLHNFLTSQPDLNYHCPAVQDAVLDVAKFWLERGTDGFRLDVVNFYFHDKALRDNPPQPAGEFAGGVARTNPYSRQRHLYDKTQPENLVFFGRLRALVDQYPGTALLGEIGDDRQYYTLGQYTEGSNRLHLGYVFKLLDDPCAPRYIHDVLAEYLRDAGHSVVCWSLGNHDVKRLITRWAALGGTEMERARVLIAFLLALPGAKCIYQGEELGFTEADVPYELIQDPFGIEFWPEFKGRDGCRTPMVWRDEAGGGFTTGKPWLPVAPEHLPRAAETEVAAPDSLFAHYRALLAWHKQHPALLEGRMTLGDPHDQALAFTRESAGEKLFCVFNLSDKPVRYPLPAGAKAEQVAVPGLAGSIENGECVVPALSLCAARLA